MTLLDRPSMLCGSAARTEDLCDAQDVQAGGVTHHPFNIEGGRLCRTQCRLVNVVEGGSPLGRYTEVVSPVFLCVVRLLLLFLYLLPPHHSTPTPALRPAVPSSCSGVSFLLFRVLCISSSCTSTSACSSRGSGWASCAAIDAPAVLGAPEIAQRCP